MDLQTTTINNRKIIALPFILDAICKIHKDLVAQKIGINNQIGFVLGAVETSSWRPFALQQKLFNTGFSKTLLSNHRRGTAVDCFPDRAYMEKIKPTMQKYGLVNDIQPWDPLHFQHLSNAEAMKYPIFDVLPKDLKEFVKV